MTNQARAEHRATVRTRLYRAVRVLTGVALIVLGVFYERIVRVENAPFRRFLLTTGGLLVASGFVFLIPPKYHPSRLRLFRSVFNQRLRMPTEVKAYLGIMIVLATGSMLGHSNTLLLVFALMAAPFILNGWIVYAMLQQVRVARHLPQRAGAGETFSVELQLHNDRRMLSSRLMRLEDQISNGREELSGRVLMFRVPAGESRRAGYRVRLMQRGVWRFGPIVVSSRFPFGLGERGRFFETHDELLVHPRTGELSAAWWRRVRGEDHISDQQRATRGVYDDEFRQIREYRQGDAVRNIHWRTSARVNDLMVREFQQNREHDAVVLLDLWRPEEADFDVRVELAASFAASVCREMSRSMRDADVAFLISGTTQLVVSGKPTTELWTRILDGLALCGGSPRADAAWLAEQAAPFLSEGLRPILITTRTVDSTEGNGGQGNALGRSAHVVVVDEHELADIFSLDPATVPAVVAAASPREAVA